MNISSPRISKQLFLLLTMTIAVTSEAVAQPGPWSNHVEPSYISEIIERDGELYIASRGGLLVFDPSDSTYQQFDKPFGLPSNFLTSLAFASDGSLYVGTEDVGMAQLRFVSGRVDVTLLNATFHGIADDRVRTVAAWGDSIVYGTEQGAGIINKGFSSKLFFARDGLPGERVSDVFADGDYVWFATDNGVARLDRLGFITTFSNGLPSLDTHVFARDDTTLWVGTPNGIAWFNAADSTWIPAGITGQAVFAIKFGGQKLWAATRGDFYENDGGGWVGHSMLNIYLRYILNTPVCEARGLQPMPDGSVYLGVGEPAKERGAFLLVYDGSTIRDIRSNSPPGPEYLRAMFDIDGSYWVSSRDLGVAKLTPQGQWFWYNPVVGDTNLTTRFQNRGLLADSQGTKWFCGTWETFAPGVLLDELHDGLDTSRANDVWLHYGIGEGGGVGVGSLRNQNAAEDPAGNRWFMSDVAPPLANVPPEWRGISILNRDGDTWVQVNPTNSGMPSGDITDVAFGPGGVVWVADRDDGVYEWRTGGYDDVTQFDRDPLAWLPVGVAGVNIGTGITSLVRRSDGVLWVGTSNGVSKLENGTFKTFRADRGLGGGLLSNSIADLVLDHDENLWVASDLGVDRIARDDDGDIRSYTTLRAWQEQLSAFFPSDVVAPLADAWCNALALHPTKNALYIATRHGISILDLSSFSVDDTDLSRVYLFPNPIRASRGHVALKIANHQGLVDVEVYSLEGELIHREENVDVSDEVVWDLTTAAGYLAASGIYLVRISANGGSVVKRVALIR